MTRPTYPATVAATLDTSRKYPKAVLREMRAFRRYKPWRGTLAERSEKLAALNVALAVACDIEPLRLVVGMIGPEVAGRPNGGGCYDPATRTITLVGCLSVVTYLHEFAHALGHDEAGAVGWSVNLFRRIFPLSYSRLEHRGHLLIRKAPAIGREALAIGGDRRAIEDR